MSNYAFTPDWNAPGTPLRQTWREIGNIDQFRWLSRADVLRQLALARDELGVRHVRAVAMYSPELAVWDHDLPDWRKATAEKKPRANWQFVDLAIEGLLELGLKPIYTTCFTPVGMTDDPTACWPDKNPTGLPRDLQQWQDFVGGGIRHHITRYGLAEVRSWYFECWNEPNLKGYFFGGTQEEFFRLWSASWHAVKSVDAQLRFGGPSTARGEWIPAFLDFTARDGTPPDYLITHVYNNDSESQPVSPFDGPASHRVKDSPHFTSGVVRGLQRELAVRGWQGEVHWNEWGRSWFLHDLLKETALEAAFIAKTMAEVSQFADQFAFWCLSDIYNQGGAQSAEFQANYGMLSLHGLRKPAWFAHVLLNRLRALRLPCAGGDELTGALSSHQGTDFSVLIHAYPGSSDASAGLERISVALPAGTHRLHLIRLGAVENNIIAVWKQMGAPPYPTPAQLKELHAVNHLRPAPSDELSLETSAAACVASFTLERPGVALLETY